MDAKGYAVDEVLEICKQDFAFYEESGGGVTISGGEPFVQFDFLLALLKELKRSTIQTAIETTGSVDAAKLFAAAPYLDLFLFDIKHYDAATHKEGTGVDNAIIVENLKQLIASGYHVLPRIPVIPDFNASVADAKGFAALLKKAGANRVQLLPFHQFGEQKYALLSKDYAYKGYPALHAEALQGYQRVFENQNVNAFF